MKLQIKTLNRKSLVVDIDESKTVYDLKHELAYYADVGVKPELQKLIYSGNVMNDEQQLSFYNIDTRKFLVVMVLNESGPGLNIDGNSDANQKSITQPAVEQPAASNDQKEIEKLEEPSKEESKEGKTESSATNITTVDKALVEQIVSMGYEESEVRQALAASYNNAERAVQYLVEGIPSTSGLAVDQLNSHWDAGNESMLPFQTFRNNPMFRRLRDAIHQNPHICDGAITEMSESCPDLNEIIAEYQDELLSALINDSDDESISGE